MSGTKRKTVTIATLDTSFRKAIHESYNYTCAYPNCPDCGNHSFRYADVSIEAAHFHNRHASAGRWHPDNVACLCHARHDYLERHNAEEAKFFAELLGETRYEWLITRMQGLYRYKPWERAEMSAHYNAQRKAIERRRVEKNEEGFIDVVAWD